MRYWSYYEPDIDVLVTQSEKDILNTYFPIWYGLMAKAGKDVPANPKITERICIDDWIVTNWAWESDKFGNEI